MEPETVHAMLCYLLAPSLPTTIRNAIALIKAPPCRTWEIFWGMISWVAALPASRAWRLLHKHNFMPKYCYTAEIYGWSTITFLCWCPPVLRHNHQLGMLLGNHLNPTTSNVPSCWWNLLKTRNCKKLLMPTSSGAFLLQHSPKASFSFIQHFYRAKDHMPLQTPPAARRRQYGGVSVARGAPWERAAGLPAGTARRDACLQGHAGGTCVCRVMKEGCAFTGQWRRDFYLQGGAGGHIFVGWCRRHICLMCNAGGEVYVQGDAEGTCVYRAMQKGSVFAKQCKRDV